MQQLCLCPKCNWIGDRDNCAAKCGCPICGTEVEPKKTTHEADRTPPPWDDLDPGIVHEVRALWEGGIETCQSCQGGQGHPYPEPTVQFRGGNGEGFRALGIALVNGLRVTGLQLCWSIIDGVPVGPNWEMTFYHPDGGGSKAIDLPDGTVTWEWR